MTDEKAGIGQHSMSQRPRTRLRQARAAARSFRPLLALKPYILAAPGSARRGLRRPRRLGDGDARRADGRAAHDRSSASAPRTATLIDQYFAMLIVIGLVLAVGERAALLSRQLDRRARRRGSARRRLCRIWRGSAPPSTRRTHSGEVMSRLTADTTQIKAAAGTAISQALRNTIMLRRRARDDDRDEPPPVAAGARSRYRSSCCRSSAMDAWCAACRGARRIRSRRRRPMRPRTSPRCGPCRPSPTRARCPPASARGRALVRGRARAHDGARRPHRAHHLPRRDERRRRALVRRRLRHQRRDHRRPPRPVRASTRFSPPARSASFPRSGARSARRRARRSASPSSWPSSPRSARRPIPCRSPRRRKGEIEFKNVHFAYRDAARARRARQASRSASRRARRVALVGPSGAGKTTVFNLLLRFYDPDCGRGHGSTASRLADADLDQLRGSHRARAAGRGAVRRHGRREHPLRHARCEPEAEVEAAAAAAGRRLHPRAAAGLRHRSSASAA